MSIVCLHACINVGMYALYMCLYVIMYIIVWLRLWSCIYVSMHAMELHVCMFAYSICMYIRTYVLHVQWHVCTVYN